MSGGVGTFARKPAVASVARARSRSDAGASPLVDHVLELQRTAGNAAVVQLVEGEDAAAAGADTEAQAKAVFDQGAAAYEKGDFAHAYDAFARAFEIAPRPGILFSQAQALRRLGGRREEAIKLYQAYLASGHGTRDAEAKQYLAELQTPGSTGDLEADTAAGKAIFDRGSALYDKGDYAHAYDEFTRAWELTQRPGLLFSRAQALRRLGGRRDEAIALYKAYLDSGHGTRDAEAKQYITELQTPASSGDLERDTETGKSIFDKGAKLYDAGDFAHAYDEFTRAWELTERPGLLFSRAQALRRLGGRTSEAISLYEEYLAQGDARRGEEAQKYIDRLQAEGVAR